MDNDGDLDIFIAMGSGAPKPDLMYRNLMKETGQLDFTRIRDLTISDDPIEGNQWSLEDIDNDGDFDLFIPGPGENSSFFRNELDNNNHWLSLKLVGTHSSRSGYSF